MKHINISKLFLIIGVFFFSAYLCYPRYKIIEVNLADIEENDDINTTINYPFEVKWDDKDYESNRPESVTYNLYNVLDENTIVSTVTLNSSNVDNEDSNKWNGVFTNIRKYNDDETEIKYIIKQDTINNYKQKYDKKEYNALCIEFGINNGNSDVSFVTETTTDNEYYYVRENNSTYYSVQYLNNRNVCIPLLNDKREIVINSAFNQLNIENIYPAVYNTINLTNRVNRYSYLYYEYKGSYDMEPYSSAGNNDGYFKIGWIETDKNFPSSDIIINEYTYTDFDFKYVLDDIPIDLYPNYVTFKIYDYKNQNVVLDTSTINKNDFINGEYNGKFSNLKKYDNSGKLIEYYVEAIVPNKALFTSYSNSNYNGLCIEFGDSTRTDSNSFFIRSYCSDGRLHNFISDEENSSYIHINNVKNRTICLPSKNDKMQLIFKSTSSNNQAINNLNINNIYPTFKRNYSYGYSADEVIASKEYIGSVYPNIDSDNYYAVRYSWQPNEKIFPNNNVIITSYPKINLSFDKYWDDRNYESYRPSESEFYLYDKLDQTKVLATVVLNSSAAVGSDNYHWRGTFSNIPKYRNDGSIREFVVREKKIENYVHSYDSEEGLTIKFSEDTHIASPYQLRMVYVDSKGNYRDVTPTETASNYLYYFGNNIAGKTYNISFNSDDVILGTNAISSIMTKYNDSVKNTDKRIEEILINNQYPEMVHPYSVGDTYVWHYKHSLSQKTSHLYIVFDSISWGPDYGMVIDEITTYGNETIITSTINLKDEYIKKVWDDNGYESYRPNSTTIDIYNANDLTTIVRTVEIGTEDQASNNIWKKTINNLPKYNEDLTECIYVFKERLIDNYKTIYDVDWSKYNGLNVTFSDDTVGGFYIGNYSRPIISSNKRIGSGYENYNEIYGNAFANHTIAIYGKVLGISFTTNTSIPINMKIINIEPAKPSYSNTDPINVTPSIELNSGTFKQYLDTSQYNIVKNERYLWYYTWSGSTTPIKDGKIITNKIDLRNYPIEKIWKDDGIEELRPDKVKVYIYNVLDDEHPVKELYLDKTNASTEDSNKWIGVFENIPKYNVDGSEIEYYVKEEQLENYETSYDKKEINSLCFELNDIGSQNINYQISFIYAPKYSDGDRAIIKYFRNPYFASTSSGPLFSVYKVASLKNIKMCIPTIDGIDSIGYYIDNDSSIPLIKNIYPSSLRTNSNYFPSDYNENIYVDVITKDEYKDKYARGKYLYNWVSSKTPFVSSDLIINESKYINIPILKKWEDAGFEDGRPTTVKYNLYNEKNREIPIDTLIITSDNVNSDDNSEWIGIFKNEPRYNDDGTIAKYYIEEEHQEKYKVDYDISNANGMCIKFGNIEDYGILSIYVKEGNYYYVIRNSKSEYYQGIGRKYLSNSTLCFPTYNNDRDFYMSGITANLNIIDIYPTYQDNYDVYTKSINRTGSYTDYIGDNLPNVTTNSNIHYIWTKSDKSFVGANIIRNIANMREEGYTKEFNDEGFEYNRPSQLIFGFYVDDDPVPKEMMTVNTSSCSNNICEINFKYVKDKDSDGNTINYTIKEISDYGYDITYEDDKIINTANSVEVKFIKENNLGKPLKGAKLAIYNKDGDLIKEFTSKLDEIKINLLPSEYTLKEIEPPEGYERSEDIKFAVNKDGTITINGNIVSVVKVVDEPIKETYSISIKKTMKGNENRDFTFEITIVGFNGSLSYTGDREGTLEFTNNKATVKLGTGQTITINNIPVNSKYTVNEIDEGYLTTIVGDKEGILNRNEVVEFINTPKEIPANGEEPIPEEKTVPTPITGIFNILSYISGAILLILSIFLIVYSKKQVKKKEIN